MPQLDHLQMLTRYRAWADRLLFQVLATMPAASLTAPQPIVFGSLLRTLHHTYCMDKVWAAHLQGVPHGFTSRNPEACPPFETLRANQAQMDEWYVRYAGTLDERACGEAVRFTSSAAAKARCAVAICCCTWSITQPITADMWR